MKIGIVGAGISGLGAAWLLSGDHDVAVYEAARHMGGHSRTVDVTWQGRAVPVDVGFIVYNEKTYPNLTRLFAALGVATELSDMSFAVSMDQGGFEYEASTAGMFAQPGNVLKPSFWRLIGDLKRFHREAPDLLAGDDVDGLSLGQYLRDGGYGPELTEQHIQPMAAAIWSSSPAAILDFPAISMVRFLVNHGLVQAGGRPDWRTVTGGSREYVAKLTAGFRDAIRTDAPAVSVSRLPTGIHVRDAHGNEDIFDEVILACHADQALGLIRAAATDAERDVLGAFQYETNHSVLHSDASYMPKRKRVWSSWNYVADPDRAANERVSVTYWMNKLQNIDPAVPLFASLNSDREPAADLVHGRYAFEHPMFTTDALAAQKNLHRIQGKDRVWFCGSYCGYGFHEDGLASGLAVAAALGSPAPWGNDIVEMSSAAAHARPTPAPQVVQDAREPAYA